MARRAVLSCLVAVVGVAILSCSTESTAIPKPFLREVDWTVQDGALMNAPEHYIGRTVILGGAVLKTAYFHDKAVLEVLHLPLSDSQRPVSILRESQGLFVAVTSLRSAAARLPPGAVITVVGEVVPADRPGGAAVSGTAPRLNVKHVHVWESTLNGEDRFSEHSPIRLAYADSSLGTPPYAWSRARRTRAPGSIVLDFEDPVGVVKRLTAVNRPRRDDDRQLRHGRTSYRPIQLKLVCAKSLGRLPINHRKEGLPCGP